MLQSTSLPILEQFQQLHEVDCDAPGLVPRQHEAIRVVGSSREATSLCRNLVRSWSRLSSLATSFDCDADR